MRDLFLERLTLVDSEGRLRAYDYYITVDEVNAGCLVCECYGIRIEEEGGLQAAARGITSSLSRIYELTASVLTGKVTPISLADVISDWL